MRPVITAGTTHSDAYLQLLYLKLTCSLQELRILGIDEFTPRLIPVHINFSEKREDVKNIEEEILSLCNLITPGIK